MKNLLLVFFCACTVYGKMAPLRLESGRVISQYKVLKGPLAESDRSFGELVVGKSTLGEVTSKLGEAKLWKSGAKSQVCYWGPEGAILMFSSDEMGGNDHVITSLALTQHKSPREKNRCSELGSLEGEGRRVGRWTLGSSPAAVQKVQGVPSYQTSDMVLYRYESKAQINSKIFDEYSTLVGTFKGGELVRIELSSAASN